MTKKKPVKWSLYKKPALGFQNAVRTPEEMAMHTARANKAHGYDINAGAVIVIDPRDAFGREYSATLLARDRRFTREEAYRFIDRDIAESAKKGTAPISGVWSPMDAVDELLSYDGDDAFVVDGDYEAWRSEALRPGFVRLVSISEGRASFSLVAYEATGDA